MWGFNESVMAFVDNQLIGGHEEFLRWAEENHHYKDFRYEFCDTVTTNHNKLFIVLYIKNFLKFTHLHILMTGGRSQGFFLV